MTVRPAEPSDRAELLRLRRILWPDCADEMHAREMEIISPTMAGKLFLSSGDQRADSLASPNFQCVLASMGHSRIRSRISKAGLWRRMSAGTGLGEGSSRSANAGRWRKV